VSSKSRDYREPRRRGFDDDVPFSFDAPRRGKAPSAFGGGAPVDTSPPQGPVVAATVKWFNPEKGFGFAELDDGSGDAFLHIRALEAAGRQSVSPGAKLRVNVGQGAKGPQITRVIEVDDSGAVEAPVARRPQQDRPRGPRHMHDESSAVEVSGTVNWFNPEKGFGFVTGQDGGKDVFVHVSVLERSGVATLAQGQAVSMRVVDTPKGREALSISLVP
jgi:CspA family cold shock protein